MKNKKYSLNTDDVKSILNGLIVALIGAALTYLSQVVTQIDFGDSTPLMVAIFSVLANVVRKFIGGK